MSTSLLSECIPLLQRTPASLDALLRGLPDTWLHTNDGEGTWTPFQVIGHLLHGETTDWMVRIERILQHGTSLPFDRFDREAMLRTDTNRPIASLLDAFAQARSENLVKLRALNLTEEQLSLRGAHPALGEVTLGSLIATWTAHDMAHMVQISRTMARRLGPEVGPWAQFLSVMKAPE